MSWLVPPAPGSPVETHSCGSGAAVAVVAGALLAWAWWRGRERADAPSVAALLVLAVAAFTVAAATVSRLDAPDRLLAPLFVPASLVLLAGIDALAERAATRLDRRAVAVVVAVVAVSWPAWHLRRTARELALVESTGRMGFTSADWRESPLLLGARGLPRPWSGLVLSNNARPVSLWLGVMTRDVGRRADWDRSEERRVGKECRL